MNCPIRCFAVFFLAALAGPLRADVTATGALAPDFRKADARLEQRVTMAEPRIAIGELLMKLSSQTGLALSAGDRDGAGDVEVAVFVKERPLGDLLDDLWSLTSYHGAEWLWVRTGKSGAYAYTLERPRSAQLFPERLRAQMQDALDREVDSMMDLALMTPEQRKQRIGTVMRELYDGDDKMAAGFEKHPRTFSGLAMLAETLSPQQRKAVLHGEASFSVPVASLSKAGRAFVHREWVAAQPRTIHPDDTSTPGTEPERITIYTRRLMPTRMMGTLIIEMGNNGGYGYSGGAPAQRAALTRLRKLWLLDGDTVDSRLAHTRLQKMKTPVEQRPGASQIETRLRQLSDCAPFSVVARLPSVDLFGQCPEPYGQPVSEWLNDLSLWLQWKWRGQSLLITDPAWFYDDQHATP